MSYKLDKETLDKVREIDGFPIGEDEDIINLSDPPHYTACPNPWLTDFVKEHGKSFDSKTDNYHKEPFTLDTSEGKNDPVYTAHSYHTKIPPKAITKYILHYTKPGDIIYDGFCGSGMSGIASTINYELHLQKKNKKILDRNLEKRYCILGDISPIATFISYSLNNPPKLDEFKKYFYLILENFERECGWLYHTHHIKNDDNDELVEKINTTKIFGKINYMIWSDVFLCPNCSSDLVFWSDGIDWKNSKTLEQITCSNCKRKLTKKELFHKTENILDFVTKETRKIHKKIPVLISYSLKIGDKEKFFTKQPDTNDLELLEKIENYKIPYWFPTNLIMEKGRKWGDSWRAGVHLGIEQIHHFYTKRNLIAISFIFNEIKKLKISKKIKFHLLLIVTSFIQRNGCLMNRFVINNHNPKGRINGPYSGRMYIPPLIVEQNILNLFESKSDDFISEIKQNKSSDNVIIQTCSSTNTSIPKNSVDYIFTDPPFGDNLMYSELNFIWESWLKVHTNNKNEAIINNTQKKDIVEYQELMEKCFRENYKILKPSRWMTVVFSNSKNKVWKAIQEALQKAGFIVADVRTLDKEHGTIGQIINISSTVKKDLVISCYKPSGGLDEFFGGLTVGTEEGMWKFINTHLKQLPIFVEKNQQVEIISERQKFLLFDRMIAFHVQKGLTVPISAAEFYEKLAQKYPERDGMYFLSEQIPEYDQKRAQIKSVEQTTIFVEDEKSAILWLNEQLKTPQTYQDIQPKFLKEIHQSKYEKLPELLEILEQNFLEDENNKWYIPDPSKLKDLEKLREKSLLREYQTYQESKGKLKQFRLEAIHVGFKKNWSENKYNSIVDIAKRLPEEIIQESSDLLMYYDNALSRI